MPQAKKEVISFHNTPSFYVGYMENWLSQKKAQGGSPAEIALVEDLTELVKLGASVLAPEPTDSANLNNS